MADDDKIVPIWLETIEAFEFDRSVIPFFDFLEKLVEDGYVIAVYRNGGRQPVQTIRDADHIRNFIRSYKRAMSID